MAQVPDYTEVSSPSLDSLIELTVPDGFGGYNTRSITITNLALLINDVVFYEFETGALSANTDTTVYHNQDLSEYTIAVRSPADDNNMIVAKLQKYASDPTNAIVIKSAIAVGSPGLTVQIVGKRN